MLKNLPSWLKSATGFSAAAGGPTRQDTYALTVQVEDVSTGAMMNLGIWDKMTGGQVAASGSSYRPGAMGPPVSLGAQKTTANVVVSRLYRLERDHDIVQKLFNGVGRAKMVVTKQPLSIDGIAYGDPIVYRGTLDRCTPPEPDSESNNAGLIELELVPEGYPA